MISWFEKHSKLSWIITILIAFIIFYLSTLSFTSGIGAGDLTSLRSIVYHIVIFFVLSLFLFISLLKGKGNSQKFFFSILILISYGILDEIHQFFVSGRFCSILDVGFDSIGILFAFMIYLISLRLK